MTDDKLTNLWSEDDLDRALGALHGDVRTDQAELDTTRATFLAAVNRPVRRKRGWAYALTAAAAVVTLVATGFVVTTNSPGGTAEAKAGLNAAADHVVAKDPVIPPGKYRYRVSHAWNYGMTETSPNKGVSYLEESLIETWIPADRSQEWMERGVQTGNRKLISGTQQELEFVNRLMADSKPEVRRAKCGDFYLNEGEQPCARAGSWQDPTPEWAAGLPRDPKALYQRLKKDSPRNSRGETELLVYAADALRTGDVPADVRSALYRALGYLDHLEVSDRAANLAGKTGIAYGSDDGTERQEIIIDPRTGDFIGERDVVTSGKDRGRVIGFSSVATSIVDRIGVRPSR
ncbi:CU044_5270 family protein [Kribbella catacumbae]|uniref:CU044_5270 family protein n=1 Tax=Kribbella catacumbae TaxID=460086 RepID=UPI00036E090C|nr:CU044_5270 family protein [Kribbella catacumbae]